MRIVFAYPFNDRLSRSLSCCAPLSTKPRGWAECPVQVQTVTWCCCFTQKLLLHKYPPSRKRYAAAVMRHVPAPAQKAFTAHQEIRFTLTLIPRTYARVQRAPDLLPPQVHRGHSALEHSCRLRHGVPLLPCLRGERRLLTFVRNLRNAWVTLCDSAALP